MHEWKCLPFSLDDVRRFSYARYESHILDVGGATILAWAIAWSRWLFLHWESAGRAKVRKRITDIVRASRGAIELNKGIKSLKNRTDLLRLFLLPAASYVAIRLQMKLIALVCTLTTYRLSRRRTTASWAPRMMKVDDRSLPRAMEWSSERETPSRKSMND